MRQAPAAVGEAVPMNVGGKCISNKTLYFSRPRRPQTSTRLRPYAHRLLAWHPGYDFEEER